MNDKMLVMASLGASACGGHLSYAEAQDQVEEDLARLEALDVIEVRGLVIDQRDNPYACYGPCPDAGARKRGFVVQAERLHDLVDLADDDLDQLGPCYTSPADIVEQSVDAIDALGIVHLGALILDEAVADPNCYNLPCPGEQERVDQINEERALRLFHLAERSSDL